MGETRIREHVGIGAGGVDVVNNAAQRRIIPVQTGGADREIGGGGTGHNSRMRRHVIIG